MRGGEDLQLQIYCGGSLPFSGSTQVDAAAEVEEDEVLCGAAELEQQKSCERKKTLERGRMRKDRSCLFIRKNS